ncbi:MAG: CBS domain-containing protein [Deltaproteobacteria bacterium]
MSLESLCRREIVCVNRSTMVIDATKMMEEKNVGSVVVIDMDRPLGILTDRDVMIRLVNNGLDAEKTPVSDVMSREIITLNQKTGLYEALEQIKDSKSSVRRFPIVDDNGSIKGIITLDDVIYLLGKEMSDVSAIIESERPRL